MYYFDIPRDELGRRLGKGVAEGTVTLIEGDDGSGKTVLTQRFTYGFLRNGHSVTYISTELSTRDFVKQMMSLRYDVTEYLLNGKLLFLPVYPPTARHLKRKKDLLRRVVDHADTLFKRDITIIDTLTLLLPEDGISDKTAFDFMTLLKKVTLKGKSVIITADPGATDEKLLEPLREIADNYLIMKAEISGEDIKNVIYVQRWKRAETEVSKIVKFRVEPNFGIVIDISSFAI